MTHRLDDRGARHMAAGGSIINIASLNAVQPAEGFAAYCSAKAGVAMLSRARRFAGQDR